MTVLSNATDYEGPAGYAVPADANAADDVYEHAARQPAHVLFARKTDEGRRDVTAAEFAAQVDTIAKGLLAAGIQVGDRIAIMSGTRYEWVLCDFAIWRAGAVTVPIYETSSISQAAWILEDSGVVAVFSGGTDCTTVIRSAAVATVRDLWTMDGDALGELGTAGNAVTDERLTQRRQEVDADSVATIVYTSGTTGQPKGCVLTHRNLVGEVRSNALADGITESVLTDSTSVLLFLPLAHIFARAVQLTAVHAGARTAHVADLAQLPAELADFRPDAVVAVPRVFEKVHNSAVRQARGALRTSVFRLAEETAVAWSEARDRRGPSVGLRIRRGILDRLAYAKLRAAFGGRLVYAVSGGAPLLPRLAHFLRGAGVPVLEGYGLTETTAGATLNLPSAQRLGTVGRPLPGYKVRIATDGEVLLKGPGVFQGYWHDEQATAEAFDDVGWLRTGDLGSLDDGYLTISGRKKELIVTAAGKNVATAFFEDRLRAHWLIDQCVVTGDRMPYVGALVALDQEAFLLWKQDWHKPVDATVDELRDDPDLIDVVQAAIDEVNATVSHAEAIKRFRFLAGTFSVGDELTPTLKVRRGHVLDKYSSDLHALYERA